jgi:hypothetical protein
MILAELNLVLNDIMSLNGDISECSRPQGQEREKVRNGAGAAFGAIRPIFFLLVSGSVEQIISSLYLQVAQWYFLVPMPSRARRLLGRCEPWI